MRFIYTKIFTKIFTVFVVVAVVIVLDASGYAGWVKGGIISVYGAFSSQAQSATNGVKNVFKTVFTIKNLARDNSELNQKVDELSFENARLKAARDENTALRRALNFTQESEYNLLSAQVLLSDPTGFSQSITIDKGSDEGVRINQPVVVAPGLLVGLVKQVFPQSAEVTLLTDPGSVVNAEVVESQARGLIRGEHGLSLLFDLVTQNEVIKTGDFVITSGLSGDYPRGLLIGEISAFRSSATDLFQKAYITPAANLRNLRFLFVIQ